MFKNNVYRRMGRRCVESRIENEKRRSEYLLSNDLFFNIF